MDLPSATARMTSAVSLPRDATVGALAASPARIRTLALGQPVAGDRSPVAAAKPARRQPQVNG